MTASGGIRAKGKMMSEAKQGSEAREIFSDFRVTLMTKDHVLALVSCKVSEAVWITGMRVCEGARGRFVAMPSKRMPNGEYLDVFFPATREMRELLQTECLKAFGRAVAEEKGDGPGYSAHGMAGLVG